MKWIFSISCYEVIVAILRSTAELYNLSLQHLKNCIIVCTSYMFEHSMPKLLYVPKCGVLWFRTSSGSTVGFGAYNQFNVRWFPLVQQSVGDDMY